MASGHKGGRNSRITRRELLKLTGAAIAASQLDLTRLTALAAAPAPVRGGVLIVGADVSPPGLDPQKSAAAHSWMIAEHVYSTLLRRDKSMRIVGDLAESYQVVNDTTYLFKLRRGVRWQHGRELVAEDIKYSFERMIDARTASPWRSIWLIIDRIETPDAQTVRFVTRRPFAPFISYVATPHYSSIVPKELVERHGDLQQNMSGTGPFMLERFAAENVVVLKRNPNYYESGLPYLDGVEYRIIPDESARLAALRAGNIHYMWSADPLIEEQLRGMQGVIALPPKRLSGQTGLAFNQTKAPFSDVRVRRAVSSGLDRKAIINTVLRGRGAISTKIPPADAPFGYSGDEKGLPYYRYEPEAARRLLAEAGYPNGFDTVLEVPSRFPLTVRTGEVMKEQLAQVGVRVALRQMEWGQALTNYIRTTYDGMSMIPLVWQPDPDAHVYDIYHSQSAINLGKFNDPVVDNLLDQGRTTVDRNRRIQIYQELQRYFADRAYMIYPFASDAVELVRSSVQGYTSLPGAQPPSRSRQFFKETWLTR